MITPWRHNVPSGVTLTAPLIGTVRHRSSRTCVHRPHHATTARDVDWDWNGVVAWTPDRRLHILDRPVRQCVRAFERDVILDRILVPTGPTPWSQTVPPGRHP